MTTLNDNALMTLAQARDHLQIAPADTSQDDRITQYINAISDHFERHCDRKLVSQDYSHLFTGDGSALLVLWQFPVTAVSAVYVDRTQTFGAGSQITDFQIHREFAISRRQKYVFPKWPLGIKVNYTAGYETIPFDLVQAGLILLGQLWDTRGSRNAGVASRAKMGESVSFVDNLPPTVAAMLAPYVRETFVKRRLAEV